MIKLDGYEISKVWKLIQIQFLTFLKLKFLTHIKKKKVFETGLYNIKANERNQEKMDSV